MHKRGRYNRSHHNYSRPGRYTYCKKQIPEIHPLPLNVSVNRGFCRRPHCFSFNTTSISNTKFRYTKPQINSSVSPLVGRLPSPLRTSLFPNRSYARSHLKTPNLHSFSFRSKRCFGRYSFCSKREYVHENQIRSRFKILQKEIKQKTYVCHTLPPYSISPSMFKFKRSKQEDSMQNRQKATRSLYNNPYRLRVRRAIETLRYKRKPVCMYYVRTGACPNATLCRFQHDKNYLRICPRFLSRTCSLGEDRCKLAHVLDPCRLPQCEYFARGDCSRESCPYLHVQYSEDAITCPRFMNGRCEYGRKCAKRHIWLAPTRDKSKVRKAQSTVRLLSVLKTSNLPTNEGTEETRPSLICAPEGSLRDVFPAPSFIPFDFEEI